MKLGNRRPNGRSQFRDQLWLLGTAILVCVGGLLFFFVIDEYHIEEKWFFFGMNSLGMVLIMMTAFRRIRSRPSFVAFALVWGCIHGFVAVIIPGSILYWIPAFLIEMTIGFYAASLLFGVQPERPN